MHVEEQLLGPAQIRRQRERGAEAEGGLQAGQLPEQGEHADDPLETACRVEVGRPEARQVGAVADQRLAPVHVGHVAVEPHQPLAQALGLDVVDVERDRGHVEAEVALRLEQGRDRQVGPGEELSPRDALVLGRELVQLGEDRHPIRQAAHRLPQQGRPCLKVPEVRLRSAHGNSTLTDRPA